MRMVSVYIPCIGKQDTILIVFLERRPDVSVVSRGIDLRTPQKQNLKGVYIHV